MADLEAHRHGEKRNLGSETKTLYLDKGGLDMNRFVYDQVFHIGLDSAG